MIYKLFSIAIPFEVVTYRTDLNLPHAETLLDIF